MINEEKNYSQAIFLGNMYGLHDGYDGSVFSKNGLCKTITAVKGGVASILEETNITNKKQETRNKKQETRNKKQETRNKKQEIVMSCYLLVKGTVFEKEAKTATTIMARDYKGLGNYRGNGVIVKEL